MRLPLRGRVLKLSVAVAITLALAGCADSVEPSRISQMDTVGFFHGYWHGAIFPFSFICSLFDQSVAVYATYNNGGWYNLGFFFGASSMSTTALRLANNHAYSEDSSMDEDVTFTVTCTMKRRWIPAFLGFLRRLQHHGNQGSSRPVTFYADGDGDFHPHFSWESDLPDPSHPRPFAEGSKVDPNEGIFDAG